MQRALGLRILALAPLALAFLILDCLVLAPRLFDPVSAGSKLGLGEGGARWGQEKTYR